MRIISLVPSQTELLFDLGVGDKVVGCTRFCIHPKEKTKNVAKIGGTKDFDFEKIAALRPTLIIGNKEENYKEGIESLQAKYNVWISDIYTLEDAYDMILRVGELTQTRGKSQELVRDIQQRFDTITPSLNHSAIQSFNDSISAAYFIWKKPLMVAGSNTFIDDMLSRINLRNVFGEKKSRYPEVDEKELAEANPQVILLSSEPYPFNERHIAYFRKICLDARVEIVDGELFSWHGSRLMKTPAYLFDLYKKLV